MKTQNSFTPAVLALAALLGSIASVRAASFTEAEFTRLENDVKVLKESATPHSAAVGENVKAVTSVATGVNSRAELKFPDQSLTRLGANSRFTIRGDQRTLDLDQGVMMLQVPKKIGGAKVRTAAVTAAVTGTTIIQEYFPTPIPNFPHGYVKLIVVEGTVDFFSNKDPSHFQEVHAGQMIIMDPTSTNIPAPVDIDLKRLLRTSKLLAGYDHMPNASFVNNALQQQQNQLNSGALLDTNLVILGMGTFVSFSNNTAFDLNGNITVQNNPNPKPPVPPFNPGNPNNNNNNNPPPSGPTPPAFQGFLPLISNTTVLNSNSTVVTDPQVTAFNSGTGGLLTSQGLIYHGQAIDGPLPYFAFGSSALADHNFQTLLNSSDNGWAAFKFDSLLINGAPNITIDNNVTDLLFVANGNITLSGDNTTFPGAGGGGLYGASWDLGGSYDVSMVSHLAPVPTLTGLALYSQNGSIAMNKFSLTGSTQDIALNAASLTGDVSLVSSTLQTQAGNLIVAAGRDVSVQSSKVQGANVQVSAGQNIISSSGQIVAQSGNLVLRALNGIQITDSSALKQFADDGGNGAFRIEAKKGPVVIQNSSLQGSNIGIQAFNKGGAPLQNVSGGNIQISDASTLNSGHSVNVRTLASGGTLTVGGKSLTAQNGVRLYSASPTGTVIFTQNTTLSGGFFAIAGKTVEVAPGVTVTVNNNHVRIFTDNALYNGTVNGVTYGSIISGETTVGSTSTFATRPKFRAGPPRLSMGGGTKPKPPMPPLQHPPFPAGKVPGGGMPSG